MAIREYKPGEHQAKFIGLRVTVQVNGDYRQKYFNFRKIKTEEERQKCWKEAEELNSTWNMERNLAQHQRQIQCKEMRRSSSAYTTGVSGVKMKFIINTSRRKKKVYRSFTPHFIISGSTDGVRFDKTINIKRFGYDMAWLKAVSFYAEKKGMSNFSHLLARKPPVEQFYVIYKYQCSLGHKIPPARIPNELDPKMMAT